MTIETKQVWVGIVMGSDSDKAIALAAGETLAALGIPRSTYYHWRGAKPRRPTARGTDWVPSPRRAWNRLRDEEVAKVLEYAHEYPDIASRELACKLTDEAGFSVSESTVYRILKRHNLVQSAPILLAARPASITAKPPASTSCGRPT